MFYKLSNMWDGKIVRIKAPKHIMELNGDIPPILQKPYKAGSNERELTRAQIEKCLKLE